MADSYTTLFSVRPEDGQSITDLFDNIATHVITWANSSGAMLPSSEPGRHSDTSWGDCEVLADSCPQGRYWRLRWNRPDGEGRPVSWASDVRLASASSGSAVEVFIQARVVSSPDAPTAERFDVGTPRLVRELVEQYGAYAGEQPLRISAVKVGVGAEAPFVEDEVLGTDRVLPILAISPRAEDNRPYLSEYQLRRFAGLAEVCFLQTAATTRNVSDLLGQDFACYNGALRVWWPGIDPENDDPRDHHLWLPARVAENPARVLNQIYNLLTRVAERRAPDGGPTWQQVREATRQTRDNEFRKALSDAELVGLADAQLDKMNSLEADLRQSRDQNELLRIRIMELEEEREGLENRLAEAYAITSGLPKEAQPASQPDINSPLDAVSEADGRFLHLRFSEESLRSAGQSLFQRPEEVYRALRFLDSLGAEMATKAGDLGDSMRARFQSEGFDYAPQESSTTMDQWAAERRATCEGKRYEMMKHLRWGGRSRESQHHLRLYFEWEANGPYWVIGHVGDHLTNTKS